MIIGRRRWWFVLGLVLGAVVAPMARADVTGADVEKAIQGGIGYLRSCQLENGSWPGTEGATDLAVFALLTAGVPPDDPALARALGLVSRHGPFEVNAAQRTYTVALHAMALRAADLNPYRPLIARDAAWLVKAPTIEHTHDGHTAAFWSYREPTGRGRRGDNSNTQYALLGLNAASEAGVAIAPDVWNAARRYWAATQLPDGGWGYTSSHRQSSRSMTTAGIASLIIAYSNYDLGCALENAQGHELQGVHARECPADRGQHRDPVDAPVDRGFLP